MEKFALLNLLKAFETLTSAGTAKQADSPADNPAEDLSTVMRGFSQPPAQSEKPKEEAPPANNVMASVLARHEQISNRIKNKR